MARKQISKYAVRTARAKTAKKREAQAKQGSLTNLMNAVNNKLGK
jgi:hypothetical protein